MIGYYIHHHGHGHLVRAQSIAARLREPVVALSSLPITDSAVFHDVVRLPLDIPERDPVDPTAHGILHWAPEGHDGLRERMAAVSRWTARERPSAMVVDVSVEVALCARLHGVPVIAAVLPGERHDHAHTLVHTLATALIAAWPCELYDPAWLRPFRGRTHFVGGISRFGDHRPAPRLGTDTVLVLGGSGGLDFGVEQVEACAARHRRHRWRTLGMRDWTPDPWPRLCAADVVVSHAGQGAVADIAAARRPAILIAQSRPFGEQDATARALTDAGLAIVLDRWPDLDRWPALLADARRLDTGRWELWRTDGAARRAAAVIERASARAREVAR